MEAYEECLDNYAGITWKIICMAIVLATSMCASIGGLAYLKADLDNLKKWHSGNPTVTMDIMALKSDIEHIKSDVDRLSKFPERVHSLESEVKALIKSFNYMTIEMTSVVKELRVLNLNLAIYPYCKPQRRCSKAWVANWISKARSRHCC